MEYRGYWIKKGSSFVNLITGRMQPYIVTINRRRIAAGFFGRYSDIVSAMRAIDRHADTVAAHKH